MVAHGKADRDLTLGVYAVETVPLLDRQTPTQPLVLAGDRQTGSRKLNRRKLSEMPHSLIGARDWRRFERVAGSLEFIEAKFKVDQGYECVGEFIMLGSPEATT